MAFFPKPHLKLMYSPLQTALGSPSVRMSHTVVVVDHLLHTQARAATGTHASSHPPRSGKEKGRFPVAHRAAGRDLLHLVALLLVPVLERRDASRKGLRRRETPRLACGGQASVG